MEIKLQNRRTALRGFTLIELVVVLVVLVALAGVLVPLMPNMITRSHSASGASSMQEAAKAIQMFEALNFSQPDGWDSLVQADGQTLRADRFTVVELAPGPVDGDGNSPGDPGYDPDDIANQDQIDLASRISTALNTAGIRTSFTMADGIQGNGRPEGHSNAPSARINTFSPYAGDLTAFEDLTENGRVVTLGPALNELNRFGFLDPDSDPTTVAYVAFGIGERLNAIGKTISAAPVHFPEAGDLPPTQTYSRFAAIYRIPTSGPAELAAVAAVHGDHFDSLNQHLQEFYETTE